MPDKRWGNPQHVPISNGLMRITTPPAAPSFRLRGDGELIEFLLPYPMHIVDERSWAALECEVGARSVSIEKPVSIVQQFEPAGRIGNESPDTACSIVRVGCGASPGAAGYPKPSEVWGVVEAALAWVRAKARHYWLLHGHIGFGSLYRGSVLSQEGGQIAQRNFASYGRVLVVRPLDEALWLSLRNELASGAGVPVSESVFCDALFSVVAGDEKKALLELGVAAEIEVTQLLSVVSKTPPRTHGKDAFIKGKGEWDRFAQKLGSWPRRLGLEEASAFNLPGIFPGWVDVVGELYRLRGGFAHSGRVRTGAGIRNISAYIFAVNALFSYCREQRVRAGIANYSHPSPLGAYDQIVTLAQGEMHGETSTAVATLG